MYNMMTIVSGTLWYKVVKGLDPKHSHQQGEIFPSFFFKVVSR